MTKKKSKATARPLVKSDQQWEAELDEFSHKLEACEQRAAAIFRELGISENGIVSLCGQVPFGQFEFQWWRADLAAMCVSLATAWLLGHPQAPVVDLSPKHGPQRTAPAPKPEAPAPGEPPAVAVATVPVKLLATWGEIIAALGLKKQDRETVYRLNKNRGGPIKTGREGTTADC